MAAFFKRVNVGRNLMVLTIENDNISFVVKVILGLESTCPDGYGGKIGLNGSLTKRVKV